MEEHIVTLATYPNITEASIVQGRLEEEGVESYVVDATLQLEDALPGPAYGGVKLQIRETDLMRAQGIINQPGLNF